jgi:hypothetical protein
MDDPRSPSAPPRPGLYMRPEIAAWTNVHNPMLTVCSCCPHARSACAGAAARRACGRNRAEGVPTPAVDRVRVGHRSAVWPCASQGLAPLVTRSAAWRRASHRRWRCARHSGRSLERSESGRRQPEAARRKQWGSTRCDDIVDEDVRSVGADEQGPIGWFIASQ